MLTKQCVMCAVYESHNKAIIFLNGINRFVYVMQTQCYVP